MEMPAAVTREAPLYSDLKEKQLPVRSIAAGDVLDYQFHTERTKAEAPGQFWGAEHFLILGGVVLSQTLTLEVPANKYVQVWDPNHPAKPVEHDGVLTYHWTSSQLKPTAKTKDPSDKTPANPADEIAQEIKDEDEDADGRQLPSVGWTTFHNWAEVGDWYRNLAQGRAASTPAIQAKATQLTKDATTPEDQVRALYDYVSAKIRYVGIDFGVGRYQPHTADEVMDHEYGDCKDKSTLLQALLRARGISSSPVLIGVNIAPVEALPSPASFNHAITAVDLPSGRIWLDTTPEVAPYRVLIPQIRDERALVIPDSGVAKLEQTPADPPFPYREDFVATATLDKDGLLKSHMDMTLRSDNELGYRVLLQRAAPAQWDQSMQYVSSMMGFGGTVTNSNLKQNDPLGPVHITYDYSRAAYADWEHMRILPLFPVLEVTVVDKDKAPEHDIDQGAPRTLVATTHLQLPDGYRADLPDAVHVKRDYATFDKTYRLDRNELIVERKAAILRKKVPKADWKDYYAYTKSIGMEDGENYISLFPSSKAVAQAAPVAKAGPTPPAGSIDTTKQEESQKAAAAADRSMLTEMMKSARQLEQDGNWDGARAMLNEVKAKDPNTPYVMSMLGYVALHDRKPDEAISDLNAELVNHREARSGIVVMLANTYVSQKRYADAEALLQKYLERNDVVLFTALANAQSRSGDDPAALNTLKNAMAAHPGDSSIEVLLANTLHKMHRDKEAATMAKAAVLGTQDASALNSNAYLLAEMKIELPLAEAASRHSIAILSTDLAKQTLQDSNSKSIEYTNILLASWDTLGWIRFEQGHIDEAEIYIRAAWLNRADLSVGNHFGQVLEKTGKPSEALDVYEMALSTANSGSLPQEVAEVRSSIDQLSATGNHSHVDDPSKAITEMHTFRLANPNAVIGSANLRVLIQQDGLQDSYMVNGQPQMRIMLDALHALKMPGVIPAGSTGLLIRTASLEYKVAAQACELVVGGHSTAAVSQSESSSSPPDEQ